MKITVVPSSINNLEQYTKVGAKAFIFGLKNYSVHYLSLSIEQIEDIVKTYPDIEVFISINKTIFNKELSDLEDQMVRLNAIPIKGVLFYDVGVLSIYRRHHFNYSLGWHQTHMVTNYNTCNYYYDKGVEYGVLASEITMDEMVEIKKKTPMKLFSFMIGHPVMAHSKRHLLTNYFNSMNKEYDGKEKVLEEHDRKYIISEDENGTCMFEGDIVNGIPYINELNSYIDYGIIYGFYIDETLLEKLVKLTKEVLDGISSSKVELEKSIGTNTGFFNKKTIFKVKKDEEKN